MRFLLCLRESEMHAARWPASSTNKRTTAYLKCHICFWNWWWLANKMKKKEKSVILKSERKTNYGKQRQLHQQKCRHSDSWHGCGRKFIEKSNESKHQQQKYFSCHREYAGIQIFRLVDLISTLFFFLTWRRRRCGWQLAINCSLFHQRAAKNNMSACMFRDCDEFCMVALTIRRVMSAAAAATIKLPSTFIHDCKKKLRINFKILWISMLSYIVCGHVISLNGRRASRRGENERAHIKKTKHGSTHYPTKCWLLYLLHSSVHA